MVSNKTFNAKNFLIVTIGAICFLKRISASDCMAHDDDFWNIQSENSYTFHAPNMNYSQGTIKVQNDILHVFDNYERILREKQNIEKRIGDLKFLVKKYFDEFDEKSQKSHNDSTQLVNLFSEDLEKCYENLMELEKIKKDSNQVEIEDKKNKEINRYRSKEKDNAEFYEASRTKISNLEYNILENYKKHKKQLLKYDSLIPVRGWLILSKFSSYLKNYEDQPLYLQKAYELANGKEKINIAFNLASAHIRSGNFPEAFKLIPLYTRPMIL